MVGMHVCLVSRYAFGNIQSFRNHTPSLAHASHDLRTNARDGAAPSAGRRPLSLHAPYLRAARAVLG
eukprot:4020175-Pleurochrysis_carterae.AAC.3